MSYEWQLDGTRVKFGDAVAQGPCVCVRLITRTDTYDGRVSERKVIYM